MYKINIEGDLRPNYINLSLTDNKKQLADWRVLSRFIDPKRKVDLITTFDAMRYINIDQLPGVFQEWRKCLNPNGIVRFSFISAEKFTLGVSQGRFDLQQTHNLGLTNNLFTVKDVVNTFKSTEFKIHTVSIGDLWATVEAEINDES